MIQPGETYRFCVREKNDCWPSVQPFTCSEFSTGIKTPKNASKLWEGAVLGMHISFSKTYVFRKLKENPSHGRWTGVKICFNKN